ncbi:MAG TPA: MBL fold metallo-hydrolase [Clostridia bacterium]|nr:MBL fold metallo-hydrolase [Clostridia bacterium]
MKSLKRLLIWATGAIAAFGVAAIFIFRMPIFGGSFEEARWERMRHSPQFHENRFENTPPQKSEMEFLKTLQDYSKGQVRKPQFVVPVVKLTTSQFAEEIEPGLRAYWFGHSTTLIEIDGIRVMTDPVFSEYASPFQGVGPKRLHPVPLALEQMPRVDAVVISHDHFDHLDMEATKHFAARGTHFYVPLGVGAHLARWSVPAQQIHEMDWWDSAEIKGVQVNCTPARHYSGRKRMDNSTLWSAWLVRGPHSSFYFSGDTGYSHHFSETRKRLGAVDLSVLKVGAYGSTWLDIQMDPESAIRAHQDLGGKVFLPVHWATFNLSYHAWDEPIVRTVAAARKAGVQIVTPAPGEKVELGKPFVNREWFLQH